MGNFLSLMAAALVLGALYYLGVPQEIWQSLKQVLMGLGSTLGYGR